MRVPVVVELVLQNGCHHHRHHLARPQSKRLDKFVAWDHRIRAMRFCTPLDLTRARSQNLILKRCTHRRKTRQMCSCCCDHCQHMHHPRQPDGGLVGRRNNDGSVLYTLHL